MPKHQEKTNTNFKSIYGDSLILNIGKSNGCFKVSIKHKQYNFFKEKSVFMGSILCAIAILRSLLDIHTCLIIIGICCMFYIVYESIFVIREGKPEIYIYCFIFFIKIVFSEKVLIIKGFGCHISKKHLIGKRTIFIPYEQIEKVFINEVIFRVRKSTYYYKSVL